MIETPSLLVFERHAGGCLCKETTKLCTMLYSSTAQIGPCSTSRSRTCSCRMFQRLAIHFTNSCILHSSTKIRQKPPAFSMRESSPTAEHLLFPLVLQRPCPPAVSDSDPWCQIRDWWLFRNFTSTETESKLKMFPNMVLSRLKIEQPRMAWVTAPTPNFGVGQLAQIVLQCLHSNRWNK